MLSSELSPMHGAWMLATAFLAATLSSAANSASSLGDQSFRGRVDAHSSLTKPVGTEEALSKSSVDEHAILDSEGSLRELKLSSDLHSDSRISSSVSEDLDNSHPHRGRHRRSAKLIGLLLLLLSASVIYMYQQRVLGKAVEAYIKQIDKDSIGVDVDMKSLWIHPLTWSVHIRQLTVENPRGYRSDYLVKIEKVILTFDFLKFVATRGAHVRIRRLIFRAINVNLEKTLTTSNVKEFVRYLYYGDGTNALPSSGRTYSLQQVLMEDIKVIVLASVLGVGRGKGVRLPVADVRYSNFAEEVRDFVVYDVARLLLQGLMKEVMGTHDVKMKFDPAEEDDEIINDPKVSAMKDYGSCAS